MIPAPEDLEFAPRVYKIATGRYRPADIDRSADMQVTGVGVSHRENETRRMENRRAWVAVGHR